MKRSKSFTNAPILYLISTPIGNLSEISKRVVDVLNEVKLVAAEDTRNSLNLLNHLGIKKPMFSLHEHNEREASVFLCNKILQGDSVAYMSDAGYPGISDPGYILVQEAIKNDIPVSVISGSCAFLSGLIPSGIDTTHFYFHGFLPSKDTDAKKELETLKRKKETLIFYESPHRIKRTLEIIYSELGERNACISRELTKLNEEYIRGTTKEFLNLDESTIKGEIVLIISGNNTEETVSESDILKRYKVLLDKKIPSKTVVEIVSEEFKINKNYIKDLILKN